MTREIDSLAADELFLWRLNPGVPPGWKLVPVEPTIAMCIAGDDARMNVDDMTRTPAIYRAMLAAAPQPPKEQP